MNRSTFSHNALPKSRVPSSSSSTLTSSTTTLSTSKKTSNGNASSSVLPIPKPINKAQELRNHLAEVIQSIIHNEIQTLPSEDLECIGKGITSPGLISMSMGIQINVFLPSNYQQYSNSYNPTNNNTSSSIYTLKSPGFTAQYHTLLTAACYNGNLPLIKLLFSMYNVNRIYINEISKSGIHPFLASCYGGHRHVVEYLLQTYYRSSSTTPLSNNKSSLLLLESNLPSV